MTRTKEQTEAIITALTKLSEKFYADMDRIVNGEIYEPNEVTEEEIESKLEELQDEAHQNNIGTNEAELEVRQRFAKWAIERMNKPPQDTTSQESKDYWKKYYNN